MLRPPNVMLSPIANINRAAVEKMMPKLFFINSQIFLKTDILYAVSYTHLKNVYQRTLAEYDNYRKRTTKEKAENYNSGLTAAVNAILPIVDTLEMALAAPTEDENFKKGIEMTMTKAVEALKSLGVAEIDALNKPFDPNFHSRVMQEETEGVEPNVVVKVFQKGYTLNNKVIRLSLIHIYSRAYLVHSWLKYPKFGHAAATDYTARYIRYGMMTRDEAKEIIKKHDHDLDVLCVRDFCDFCGYTETEFWAIIDKFYKMCIRDSCWFLPALAELLNGMGVI